MILTMQTFIPNIRWSTLNQIVILTGAGTSAGSGLPTYRGKDGIWQDNQVSHLSQVQTLAQFPDEHWAFWTGLRAKARQARPNPAHIALAQLAQTLSEARIHLVTQNVDGLHQRAGSPHVGELHGSLHRTRCTQCDAPPFEDERVGAQAPKCTHCHGALRVDIVLFGEHPNSHIEHQTKLALRDCDFFLAVGTSGNVWPASNFVRGADYAGAFTMLVNLERPEPHNPYFHDFVEGKAEEILPTLCRVAP